MRAGYAAAPSRPMRRVRTPRKPPSDTAPIAEALGHDFRDPRLLLDALTHTSFANEAGQPGRDNERLEFVGDAVVGLVVATLVHAHFPDAPEGELTQRRAALVSGPALAERAAELGLGAALRLGRGEERTGGREKPRLLAGALEACIAAVYLDAGFDAAFAVAQRIFEPLLDALGSETRDFKTRLQVVQQQGGHDAPRYEVLSIDGPRHARAYHVALHLDGVLAGEGRGRSKSEAEQDAARAVLAQRENRAHDGA
jgi:ribonuclease-3